MFRSKVGSWLTLIALAVQLCLSCAHVHRDGVRACSAVQATLASQVDCKVQTALRLLTVQTASAETDSPVSPSNRAGLPFDGCVLCALASLVSPPPTAPDLARPTLASTTRFDVAVAQPLAAASYRLFQARAPPLA